MTVVVAVSLTGVPESIAWTTMSYCLPLVSKSNLASGDTVIIPDLKNQKIKLTLEQKLTIKIVNTIQSWYLEFITKLSFAPEAIWY